MMTIMMMMKCVTVCKLSLIIAKCVAAKWGPTSIPSKDGRGT